MAGDTGGDYVPVQDGKKKEKEAPKPEEPWKVQAFPPVYVLMNPFSWLLWIIDFAFWLVICLPCCCGPCKMLFFCVKKCFFKFSVTDPDGDKSDYEDETNRRRNNEGWTEGLLETPFEDEENPPTTSWEILQRSCTNFADSPCFGTREWLGMTPVTETEKYPKAIFGETNWTYYGEAGQDMANFGAGLRALGLQPLPPTTNLETTNGPHTMLIFEDTCQEWMTSLIGAHSQSMVVATSYATLGINAVVDALKEGNVSTMVCNRKNVAEMLKVAPDVLKTIIYTNYHVTAADAQKPVASNGKVKCISYEEVLELGKQSAAMYPPTPPTPEMLAVIMYTSGSTGKPKGVMIPHSCIAASVASLRDVLPLKNAAETYIAYLPAAHIFEFCAELSMLAIGAEIGYSDTKTITSKGAVRMGEDGELNTEPGWPNPPGGVQEFSPTLMVAVPVVWDTFKKTIEETVGKGSKVVRWLFQVAYSAAYYARKQGRSCPVLNFIVFRKVQKMVGGKLKFGISGGGPISQDVQEFMSIVGNFPLFQGYGLTETCCAGTVQEAFDTDPSNVGGPLPSCEIKLRSCDGPEDPKDREGEPYLATDEEHMGEPCIGRGEVCIRGPAVSNGYFKQPQLTQAAWDGPPRNGGWFRTGDIAYWDSKGRLHIVDRLKNLIKLKGGEYIAVENMEKEYSTSAYVRSGVSGGIMCYGDGDLRRPVALVQANMPELKKWAAGSGLSGLDDEALCANKEAEKAVLDSLKGCAKGKLGGNEVLCAIRLISGHGPADGTAAANSPWDPGNGCRTASGKLERKNIQKTHPALMEALKAAGV